MPDNKGVIRTRIWALSGEDIIATQHVTRWHMVRTRRHQSLAEHLGVVAMLAGQIASLMRLPPEEQLEVFDYALTHDAHEVEFGDLPAIMKAYVPADTEETMHDHFWGRRTAVDCNIDRIPPKVRSIVYLADKLEAATFYTLEGSDPDLKKKINCTAMRAAAELPPEVEQWARKLLESVERGTFTPQPTKLSGGPAQP